MRLPELAARIDQGSGGCRAQESLAYSSAHDSNRDDAGRTDGATGWGGFEPPHGRRSSLMIQNRSERAPADCRRSSIVRAPARFCRRPAEAAPASARPVPAGTSLRGIRRARAATRQSLDLTARKHLCCTRCGTWRRCVHSGMSTQPRSCRVAIVVIAERSVTTSGETAAWGICWEARAWPHTWIVTPACRSASISGRLGLSIP